MIVTNQTIDKEQQITYHIIYINHMEKKLMVRFFRRHHLIIGDVIDHSYKGLSGIGSRAAPGA